jgi:hypothetical protein
MGAAMKTSLTPSDAARGKAAYSLEQADMYLAIYREECHRGDLKQARISIRCAVGFLEGAEVAVNGIEDWKRQSGDSINSTNTEVEKVWKACRKQAGIVEPETERAAA